MVDPEEKIAEIKAAVDSKFLDFEQFLDEVRSRTTKDTLIAALKPRCVYKERLKDWPSLEKKILGTERNIHEENVFSEISDIAGARIVVFDRNHVWTVHDVIMKNVESGRWLFRERPKAYEHDITAESEFSTSGFVVSRKDSYYTSLHYLLQPASDPNVCCELQVRTAYEEVWAEIEHYFQYKGALPEGDAEKKKALLRILAQSTVMIRSLIEEIFSRPDAQVNAKRIEDRHIWRSDT
jgi:putative GTP pyrophosphokinase